MAITFKTKADILAVPAPTDKAALEIKHEHEPGFYVRIMKPRRDGSVTRLYFARLTAGTKKSTQTIGSVDEMSVKEALQAVRDLQSRNAAEAKAVRELAKTGKTPEGLEPITLKKAWEKFVAEHVPKHGLKPTTITDYLSKLRPLLDEEKPFHAMYMHELDVKFWQERYNEVLFKDGQRTAPTMAWQTMRTVSTLYEFLVVENHAEINPIKLFPKKAKAKIPTPVRKYVPAEDLRLFMSDLLTKVQSPQREFILVMTFTGFRRALMGRLNFARVDFKRRAYLIKPTDIGAKKIPGEFLYPFPDYIWETVIKPKAAVRGFLDGSATPTERDWIFESPKWPGRALVCVRHSFEAINERTGLEAQSHAMRRSVATLAANTPNINGFAVSRLLTHTETARPEQAVAVTALYVKTPLETLREASNRVANEILRCSGLLPAE